MARPWKVYGAMVVVGSGPVRDALVARGMSPHMVQARAVVAAPSAAAAMRALGLTRGAFTHSGCETGNPVEIAVATTAPGLAFVAPLNGATSPDRFVPYAL